MRSVSQVQMRFIWAVYSFSNMADVKTSSLTRLRICSIEATRQWTYCWLGSLWFPDAKDELCWTIQTQVVNFSLEFSALNHLTELVWSVLTAKDRMGAKNVPSS